MSTMEFICFDGETHDNKYFLLGNNTSSVVNYAGISSKECFDFLWNEMEFYKGHKFIIFRISFDVNFWIKDLPEREIRKFIKCEEIQFGKYKLQYFQDKMLVMKREKKKYIIYDIYNFFQKSFLNVIKLLKIKLTIEENNILELGKTNRITNFTGMNLFQIKKYNQTECIISSKIGGVIYQLMKDTKYTDRFYKEKSLLVNNFYGASAISSKILNDFGFKELSMKMLFKPDKLLKILESAYYGGRMEALKVGTFTDVYKYDINSAYPSIINNLREVKSFELKKYKNENIIDTNLYAVNYKIFEPDMIGLLPHRHSSGMLFFPADGKGWYYGFEIKQLKRYAEKYFIDYTIFEFYEVTLGKQIFSNQIEDLYNQRLKLIGSGDLRQYIIKITLNSLYGKLAQRSGLRQFFNMYYAGLITSYCRAKLLSVSIDNYKDIIFFATDGILSKVPLYVNEGTKLGEWQLKKYKKVMIILSGVYFLINGKIIETARRGYKFDYEKIKRAFVYNKTDSMQIIQNMFIGWKFGLKNHIKYKSKILQFVNVKKTVSPYSNIKRSFDFGEKFNILNSYDSILHTNKDISIKVKKIDFEKELIDE